MPSESAPLSRRHSLSVFGGSSAAIFLGSCKTLPTETTPANLSKPRLPWDNVFKGEAKFDWLKSQAKKHNWARLPIGERTATVGKALCGVPYGNYTLEIDDRIESPSANFLTMDCWTFYEISLAFARMIKNPESAWSREAMLYYIELKRYRDGQCTGNYLSRMHHLEEVFANNEQRGLGENITKSLGGIPIRRNVREMQSAWLYYRYLKNDQFSFPASPRSRPTSPPFL